MSCVHFSSLTAWPCSPVMDGAAMRLVPPVTFWDGTVIPIYVFDKGDHVDITDDGGVLDHLSVSGFDLEGDKRRRKGIEALVEKWGARFGVDLQIWCKKADLPLALQRYLGALFAVRSWESENAGKSRDEQMLISEVELYVRALRPLAAIEHDIPLRGISGRSQIFPLRVDSDVFDATSGHPASSAAIIKKLVDIRGVRENAHLPITVVLDDRGSSDRARGDTQVFSQLAHVELLSQLELRAADSLKPQ